jgi:hypothetical protein
MPKMAMLKIQHLGNCSPPLKIWACDLFLPFKGLSGFIKSILKGLSSRD